MMRLRMNAGPRRDDDETHARATGALAAAVTLVAEQGPGPEALPSVIVAAPEPGQIIDGAYRVIRALGQGGMGVVLLAHDERLDRDVAIKVIRPRLLRIPNFRKRFLAEARAMARVRHENVVAIHAFGELTGVPYFVMEYVIGTDLETWSDAHSPLHVDEAVGILAQICRGVQAIHDAGAVHRDLKPSNVLIGSGMRVAVADFGLAHLPADVGASGSFVLGGTPEYMAPELVTDEGAIGPASDLYSLGVIAYLLLTGHHPFPDAESLARRFLAPAPRPSEARPELPAAFDAVVVHALAHDPDQRPASARAMSEALQAARRRPPSSAPRPPRVLVADDDPHMRALLTATLRATVPGARIESVADGQSALAALDREPADVALVDLQMPGLNGLEVTASLRASERGRRTPILIMTAVGGAADWRVLAGMGASGFLVKPFTPQQLAAAVSRALEVPA
jgi:eukaryotic-like serine/threonine-protein kinase